MKKKTMMKGLSLLLCGAMFLGMTGCGKKEEKVETTAKKESGDVTEVVFWHSYSGATEEALKSIIDGYNEGRGKEKNIHVELVYQGYEGTDKVTLAYQTKDYDNAPDINVGLTSTLPSVMEMGWSVSAQDFMEKEGAEVTKDTFYEQLQRACTYKDEMVAIPFSNSIPLLYYNVDMLKEAGFTEPPKTMDELTEYVEALTVKEGDEVKRYGLNMQVKRYQLMQFCVSQNENSFFGDKEGGRTDVMEKITAGEDGTMEAFLEKLQALLETGGYKYVEDNINEEFAQGLSAMVIMSSSRLGTMDELMDGKYMTAFLPKVNEEDTNGAAVGGSCLNIFDRGDKERLDAAWDVVQYCVSPESQYTFSTASGYLPVNVECENMEEMKKYYEEKPQYKVALDQMKAANPLSQESFDPTYNEINGIITETMLEFCQGTKNVEETVTSIVNQCNASLDEYHEANG